MANNGCIGCEYYDPWNIRNTLLENGKVTYRTIHRCRNPDQRCKEEKIKKGEINVELV